MSDAHRHACVPTGRSAFASFAKADLRTFPCVPHRGLERVTRFPKPVTWLDAWKVDEPMLGHRGGGRPSD